MRSRLLVLMVLCAGASGAAAQGSPRDAVFAGVAFRHEPTWADGVIVSTLGISAGFVLQSAYARRVSVISDVTVFPLMGWSGYADYSASNPRDESLVVATTQLQFASRAESAKERAPWLFGLGYSSALRNPRPGGQGTPVVALTRRLFSRQHAGLEAGVQCMTVRVARTSCTTPVRFSWR